MNQKIIPWLSEKCQQDEEKINIYEATIIASGYRNSGNLNSGNRNSGDWNSGDWNSGDLNSGNRNSGDLNSGNRNSGNWNSGNRNSGNWNSGNWNSGNWNSGFFNTTTPDEILVFNKLCSSKIWSECIKPNFIFFKLTEWISKKNMTDQEKINNPNFFVSGGYLKINGYKEAWRKSWNNTSDDDRQLVLNLPNFCPKVFLEISGIDVIKELNLEELKNETSN